MTSQTTARCSTSGEGAYLRTPQPNLRWPSPSYCIPRFGGGIVGNKRDADATAAHVATTTLDSWAAREAPSLLGRANTSRPSFLLVKLDIEGAAALALKGARLVMSRATHIFVGLHNRAEVDAAKRAFKPPGYEVLLERATGTSTSPNAAIIFRRVTR